MLTSPTGNQRPRMHMPMGRANDQFYQSPNHLNDDFDEEGEIAAAPPQPAGPPPMTHPRMQGKTCHRCGGVGHFARDCPSSRDNRTCRVCGEVGHIARDCPMNRQGGPPPAQNVSDIIRDRDWDALGGRESNRDVRDRERGHVEPDRSTPPTGPIRKSFSHERWGGRGASREDGELVTASSYGSERIAPIEPHLGRRAMDAGGPMDVDRPPSRTALFETDGGYGDEDVRYQDRDKDVRYQDRDVAHVPAPVGVGLTRFSSAPPAGTTSLDDFGAQGSGAAGAATPNTQTAKKGGWGGGLGAKASASKGLGLGFNPNPNPNPSASKGAWGKGLARSKSALPGVGGGGDDSNQPPTPTDGAKAFFSFAPAPSPSFASFDGRPLMADDVSNPPLPGGAPPPGQEIRQDLRTPPPDWEDPAAKAARLAAVRADAAAKKELVDDLAKKKGDIMTAMEETDAEIEKLELEIAELDERDVNDKEQAEEQARHQEARLDRELDNLKRSVERAERNAEKAALEAEEAKAKSEKLRKKAGLNKAGEIDPAAAIEAAARSRRCAEMIQEMTSGDEPRADLVARITRANEIAANKSHDGLKHTCGLPLARELPEVSVEATAARNFAIENDPSRAGVREAVKDVLRRRRAAVSDKQLTLAVTYLKRREKWRVRMVAADRTRLEKMYGVKPGGKLPTPGSRGSGRLNSSMAGVAKSDYEEMQILQQLQRVEALKSIIKLPPQVSLF